MSTPNDGSEPRSASTRSTGSPREALVDTPRSGDAVAAGSSRTPPPRPRRGAPTSQSTATEGVDVETPDPADEVLEPVEPTPAKPSAKSSKQSTDRGNGGTQVAPTPVPADSTPTASATTVAAAAALSESAERPTVGKRDLPRAKVVKRPERRFTQTVVKVDLWSVTKMALCFYVSAVAVTVVALTALWVVADSAGIIGNVEKFIGDLFSSKDFHFVSAQVLRGGVLVAIVLVALLVVFTIIAASFYNIFAELFGGVEIVIREEEAPPKR